MRPNTASNHVAACYDMMPYVQKIPALEFYVVVQIASAKHWSARGESRHPTFMGNCPTII